MIRAVTTPVYAALASALAFLSSASAQDVVLNSTAIGFVFGERPALFRSALLPTLIPNSPPTSRLPLSRHRTR